MDSYSRTSCMTTMFTWLPIIKIFNCGEHLKSLEYSAQIENEETLHQHIFYACKAVCSRPRTFEKCKGALSGISMHILIQVEGILSFC